MRIDYCPTCNTRLDVRSSEQNRKLHALLGDIAKQKQWAGQWLSVEDWKRLMTSAWIRARGGHVRLIPSVDGQGFDVLYQHTSRLPKSDMIELIEYIMAWAADNGVTTHEPTQPA